MHYILPSVWQTIIPQVGKWHSKENTFCSNASYVHGNTLSVRLNSYTYVLHHTIFLIVVIYISCRRHFQWQNCKLKSIKWKTKEFILKTGWHAVNLWSHECNTSPYFSLGGFIQHIWVPESKCAVTGGVFIEGVCLDSHVTGSWGPVLQQPYRRGQTDHSRTDHADTTRRHCGC